MWMSGAMLVSTTGMRLQTEGEKILPTVSSGSSTCEAGRQYGL
jgi:hypothetical protein